jgi:hypothetical protein
MSRTTEAFSRLRLQEVAVGKKNETFQVLMGRALGGELIVPAAVVETAAA